MGTMASDPRVVSIPKTVLGGLQSSQNLFRFRALVASFNTENGIRRATIVSQTKLLIGRDRVSIPKTVLGGLQ